MTTINIAKLYEFLFYGIIIILTFSPISGYKLDYLDMNLRVSDIFLLFSTIIFLPIIFAIDKNSKSARNIFLLFGFIIVYSLFSTVWVNNYISYKYTFYQLALAFITLLLPFLASKIIRSRYINYQKLLSNVAIILSLTFVFYMVFFGMERRLAGPIGSAAIISVIVIPTIAIHYYNITTKFRPIISTIMVLVALFGLFVTQSRVGLVMLVFFIVLLILRKPTINRVLSVSIIGGIFYLFFSKFIDTSRYTEIGFTDISRTEMFKNSMDWWTSSWSNLFFGEGYGSIWQWAYHQHRSIYNDLNSWIFTEHGGLMYHAHSLFNQLVAETGLIGLVPFIIVIMIVIIAFFKNIKRKNELNVVILLALISTLPTFLTDLMVFRNWGVSIIWLFFLFSVLQNNTNYLKYKTPL